MVFNGKLSAGCDNCRKLHVKCDEKQPSCSRCLRMRRTCSGYRDAFDLVLRRVSFDPPRTTKSAHVKPKKIRQDSAPVVPDISTLLSSGADELALGYFYHFSEATLPATDHTRRLHQQLPGLHSRTNSDSTLSYATQALALAIFDRAGHGTGLQAKSSYVKAIRSLNLAIQDTAQAKSDETLYAVLLLSGYETVTFQEEHATAWGPHVDGSVALLRLRGAMCLQKPISQDMFLFVRRACVLNQMQKAEPVDDFFHNFGAMITDHENTEDRLLSKTMNIPKLQRDANDLFHSETTYLDDRSATSLVENARRIDLDLYQWAKEVPPDWDSLPLNNVPREPDPYLPASPSLSYRYSNFHIARVWNLYRVARLIVQSIIRRGSMAFRGSNELDPESSIQESEIVSQSLVDDICGSVHYLMGPAIHSDYDTKAKNRSTDVPRNGHGMYSLIWPLYIAISVPGLPTEQTDWMKQVLTRIGEAGHNQAKLASLSESKTLSGGLESLRFDCV